MKRTTRTRTLSQQLMKLLRVRLQLPINALMLACTLMWSLQGNAATLYKTNSGNLTYLAVPTVGAVTSNVQNATPTASDVLLFNNIVSGVSGAQTYRMSNAAGTLSLQGITILNPGAAITIQNNDNQAQTLALGSGGLDLSRANQNLTITTGTGGSSTLNMTNAGAGNWRVASGRTLTVNSVLTGVGTGLTITGGVNGLGGTVTLSGANTFTGATSVTNNTLNLNYTSAADRISAGSSLSLTRATLNLQGTTTRAQTVAGLTLGTGANQITRTAGSSTLSVGAITRSSQNALLNIGTASVVTTTTPNTNGIMGGWAVVNKTDWAVGGGAITALASGSYTSKSGDWTVSPVPGATANVLVTGTGVTKASGTINSIKFNTGSTSIAQSGTLNITSGGILKNDNNGSTISGGVLTAGGTADGAADMLYIWNNQNTMVISSTIANNGGDVVGLTKAGNGTLQLTNTAAHTMTGTLTITGGRVLIGAAGTTGTLPGTNVVFAIAPGSLAGTATDDGMLVYNRTDSTTWTQNFTGIGGDDASRYAIRKVAGTASTILTLTPTVGNTYAGGTYIQNGVIAAGNTQALSPNSKFNLANTSGVALNLNSFSNSVRGLTGGGTIGGNVTLGSATLTLQSLPIDNLTFGGVISGTGGLTKNGEGTQAFTATQTFSGPLTVNAGTLAGTTFSPNSVTVNGGTLKATTRITTSGGVTIDDGIVTAPLTLNGGAINVTGNGGLYLGAGSVLPANVTVNLGAEGSTLQMNNGSSYSIGSLTSAAGSRLLFDASSLSSTLTFNDTGSLAFDGIISMATRNGTASVVKAGSSTWTMSGGNDYNGSTAINNGVLRVAGGALVEVLPDNTAVTLANSAGVLLDINGKKETIGSLAGGGSSGGNVALGSGTLTVGQNGSPTTFAGVISGTGSLVKTGNGVLTLTGANTLTGPITVLSGGLTLAQTGGATLPNNANVQLLGAGATLSVSKSQTLGSITASKNSVIDLAAGATLTTTVAAPSPVALTADVNTATRIINISSAGGTSGLTPGMAMTGLDIPTGTYIVQILNQSQVLINQAVNSSHSLSHNFVPVTQIAAAMTGAGNWTKTGTGTVVLSGNNTMSGTMQIADGVVQVGGINLGGRNIIQDVLSNSATIDFGTTGSPTLNFAANDINLTAFERVGAISGGTASSGLISLSNASTSTILAVGGNNASTLYQGQITGVAPTPALPSGAWLIKEGTGTFEWQNNAVSSLKGIVRVEAGQLKVSGTNGLDTASNVMISNKAGATLTISTTQANGEIIDFITGGGHGATRQFSNLAVSGALGGNYLNSTGGTLNLESALTLNNNLANAVYSYGGAITGSGTLTKQGNNILEIRGTGSTHTGTTIIQSVADNTTSVIRLGAYSAGAGVGSLGIGGFGALSSQTNLVLTGTGVTGRNTLFDINGGTQTLNSLTASGSVTRTVNLNNGTLNINTLTGTGSGSYTGVFTGRGTINVTKTIGTTGWELKGDSNGTQTGALNVSGTGTVVTLGNDFGFGTLGDTVHVNVGTGATVSLSQPDAVGSLAGSGAVTVTSATSVQLKPGLSLNLGAPSKVLANGMPDTSALTLASRTWSGSISGAGGVNVRSRASLIVNSNQNFTGSLRLAPNSVLFADYSAGASNIIPATLGLNGGTIILKGNSLADSASTTNLGLGDSLITRKTGDFSMIGLGNITRVDEAFNHQGWGGTLAIKSGAAHTSTPNNPLLGIIGAYATYGDGYYITDWAVANGAGNAITGLDQGSLDGGGNPVFYSPDGNGSNVNSDFVSVVSLGGAYGSMRFNSPGEFLMEATDPINIESGGILVTANVGKNDVTITDYGTGYDLTGGLDGSFYGVDDELIIQQHNPFGRLILDMPIASQTGAAGRLVKAGQGTLVLAQDNAYSGETLILGGMLQLGDPNFNSDVAGNVGTFNANIANYGYLSINRADTGLVLANNITGTGSLRMKGFNLTAAVQLSGSGSSYSGATSILTGTVRVSSSNALGSTAGLTTVWQGGKLDLSAGVFLPETVVLRGGSLGTRASAATLSGTLIAQKDAVLTPQNSGAPLTLSGPINVYPGKVLTFGGAGTTILASPNVSIGNMVINSGASLQIGNNTVGTAGRGSIVNNGTVFTNTNNGHLVLSAAISGTGNFYQMRNTVYLTGDNTYTGGTIVGGNLGSNGGAVGVLNQNAELRVGADTYTGSLGSGPIVIQSSSGGQTNLRFHLIGDTVLSQTITINPWTDTITGRNADLLRQGLGAITITGDIIAGSHAVGGGSPPGNPNTQRALLQTEAGGKTTIAAHVINGEDNRLNLINNGVFNIEGSYGNTYYGVLSGGGVWKWADPTTTTLKGANTFSTSNSFLQLGKLVIDFPPDPLLPAGGLDDNLDMIVLKSAELQFNYTETLGVINSQSGATVRLMPGVTLTLDDNTNQAQFGKITGDGVINFNANGGSAWYGLFNANDYTGNSVIGAPVNGTTTQVSTVRVNNLQNAGVPSSLGAGDTIILGLAGSTQEARLEYVGTGDQSTNRPINLDGAASTIRISANGNGKLDLNGPITITGTGNKTLMLHGQSTIGNTVNGVIDQGSRVLTLSVNPNVANNDLYGASKWTLTNPNNNFSGNISVGVGTLELAGDLKTGTETTSVMGNLNVTRTIDLATNNFDGRRYDITGGGDNLGASSATSTGALVFNDPNAGTATFSNKITFTQSYNSTTNPGNGRLVNLGQKQIVINGNLTVGATGNRNWVLDGTNTTANTINGVISNGSGGAVVGIIKEGSGTWRIAGNNTFTGTVTISRGTLEISGGNAIGNSAIVNLSNAGSNGTSAELSTLHVLQSETIGRLQGGIGSMVDVSSGQVLTLTADADTFNGEISGLGGFTRTDNGAARISTFTNRHSYQGPTTITSASNLGSRIDVLFLANGGQASGIGAATSDAANLVLNMGTGGGGLRWIGATNQSTDRLLTLGAGTAAGAIWADGQSFGDFVPSIQFTNTGAIGFLSAGTAQTFILRGSNLGENMFAPKITNNGAGVTSLTKTDPGVWILTNSNTYSGTTSISNGTLALTNGSALGTGSVTIGGGTAGLQLRGGITVNNNVSNTVSNGGIASSVGANVLAGTLTLAGTNANLRIGANAGASLEFRNVVGGNLGSGRMIKYERGDLIFSATNTYTGIMSVSGGRLVLNYDTAANGTNASKLADAQALELGFAGGLSGIITGLGGDADVPNQSNQPGLGGGTLVLSGGSHTEIVSATTINNGANRIVREGGTSVLQMGAITRTIANGINDYGTIDFGVSGIATTSTLNSAGGILATSGTSTANSAYATVNKRDWAATGSSGTNAVTAFSGYSDNSFGSNQNTNITSDGIDTGGSVTTHTLRFGSNNSGSTTLNLSGTLSLETGGILVSADVTDDILITGGTINRSATTANLDTVIHQHGSGTLTIASVIANNSGAQALTKTGAGKVVLTGANTFTGRVSIQQGVLQVGDGTAATASARLGNTNNPISMSDGAELVINVANPSFEFNSGQWSGGGTLRLAGANTSAFLLDDDNNNWVGDIIVDGGTLRIRGNNNALGNLRGITTINGGGVLNLSGSGQTFAERITLNQGAIISATNNATTNTSATISGVLTLNNTSPDGAVFDVGVSTATGALQALTLSNVIRGNNGFTKTGNGIMTVSANQFQTFLDGAGAGFTTPNADPALLGKVVVAGGELRVGNPRALGATGEANATVVLSGATVDLRGQSLNWSDVPDTEREHFQIAGSGVNNTGALRNSTGTGQFSFLELTGNATIAGGGYANGSRIDLASFDTNPNTGSSLDGAFTRNQPVIDGNGFDLTIMGGTAGGNVILHNPEFASALHSIIVREGNLRIEEDAPPLVLWNGLSSSDITAGIEIGYGGAGLAEYLTPTLGVGANVGARLNFYRNADIQHTVNISMNGVLAEANNGYNYIDIGTDTVGQIRTYLGGNISLTGNGTRNIIHIDSSLNAISVVEQGNLTGTVQPKMIVNGAIVGSGGFTKTGFRELRLTNDNTFTGELSILRYGTAAVPWQTNTVNINGVDYQTHGDAEGWAEWGVTLAGANARLSGTSAINLERRGMLVLDNTNRLDETSLVTGGNNNDRINDSASFSFRNGWLRIIGGNTNNTESLATTGGAQMRLLSGTNVLDLWPKDGAGTNMTVTIGQIVRSPGAVLRIQNLDATAAFGTSTTSAAYGNESVRVKLNTTTGLTMTGAGTSATNKSIAIGVFGGTIPTTYLDDLRTLGFNNANVSDLLNQGRNQQFLAGSHFMTYDGGYLRPLDDSEYFTAPTGLLDIPSGASGQNVNLMDTYTVARQDLTINALRFGPLADNNGSSGGLNSGTNVTSFMAGHNIQLYVDGTLKIESGMISSAFFEVGNATNLATLTVGGTLDFGSREAIINNQNGAVVLASGSVSTGNLELRSIIAGTGGLLKTGLAQVVLDGNNTYSGVTTISDGTLFLRNGRSSLGAAGPGNGVVIESNGSLNSGSGIQVGSPTAYETVLIKALQGDQQILRVNDDLTNWFANVIIDNIDGASQAIFTPRIRTDNSATSIINGTVTGGATSITNDVIAIDSRVVQFDTAGNNTFIFRGQFGDKLDANGKAVPIADPISTLPTVAGVRTNENEVLRVNLAGGSDETNFVFDRNASGASSQYNAAGRLTVIRGTVMIDYDPNAPGNDGTGFWTTAALSKIPNADSSSSFALNGNTSQHGFTFGTTANTYTGMFLTTPGQWFNMRTWSTAGTGIKVIGGWNDSGTVTYGDGLGALTLGGTNSRFYANSGGTVVVDQRLTGSPGTAPNNFGMTKTGRGTLVLKNTGVTSSSNSNLELSGGTLVLDYTGQNFSSVSPFGMVARLGQANAALAGGTITTVGNASATTSVGFAITNAANSVLQFRLGGSEIIAQAANQDVKIAMGSINANNNAANLTRALGATANLVETSSGAGLSQILWNFNAATTAAAMNRAVSWATYGTAPRTATDFAMTQLDGFTFTGTTAASSTTISAIPAAMMPRLLVGMPIYGPGIPAGATIASISAATSITISIAATSATSGGTFMIGGDVSAYNRAPEEYVNNVTQWAAGMDVSENGGAGFFGTLANSIAVNTLRFDSAASSTITIGSGKTLTVSGDNIAGGILVSSNTGTGNKTITGGSINTTAPDLVFHQYGKGILDVSSVISGSSAVVVTGPNTTNPSEFGSTGVVRFSNANTYTSRTIVTGSVLEISDMSALGAAPATVTTNGQLTLNGGTVRWTGGIASMGNRDLRLEGSGGVIDVTRSDGNFIIGSGVSGTQAQIASQEIFRGDLIKTGPGTLTFQGSGLGHNGGFQGLLDIRAGSLMLMLDVGDNPTNNVSNVSVASILGTNRSWADGTILRTGANLQAFLGNGNNSGDWNIEEFFTFEGNNTFTYSGIVDINSNLGSTGALNGQLNLGNRRPLNLNGPIDVKGATTFDVGTTSTLRLNNGSGYLTGSGDIIKDGLGQLEFRANIPDWTGNLVVKQGTVYAINQADVLGTGYASGKKITLGDTDRAGTAQLLMQTADSVNGHIYEVSHDIEVTYNPAQTKRLGIDNMANGDTVNYNGGITMNDNLILLIRDVAISAGGEQAMVNFNGNFKDGAVTSGNILIESDDTNFTAGNPTSGANDLTSGRTYGYAVLNGNNSAWSGDVTISANSVYNQDNTAILRLGSSNALTAKNDVTMNFNSILQAGGSTVTIGSLTTQGGVGAFTGTSGTMSNSGPTGLITGGSSEVIENAASTPGTLTIYQSTPVTYEAQWDAMFRDGTLNSQFFAPGANILQPSAALNIVKDGSGWATLTLDNDYSGTTTVKGGVLQVGRNGIGDTGLPTALGTTVMNGGTLAGTGMVQGRGVASGSWGVTVQSGGVVSPGDLGGAAMGTITMNADALFQAGMTALMQVRLPSYNNPGVPSANIDDPIASDLYKSWRDGIKTDTFSNGLNEPVTSSQHDQVNVLGTLNWGVGTKVALVNDGYTPKAGDIFRLFNFQSVVGGINVGAALRTGTETGTDLTLFELGGDFLWDVSRFNSDGILMVVSASPPTSLSPPVVSTPTANPSSTSSSKLAAGTSVTVSVNAGGNGLTYQWSRRASASDPFTPVEGAISSSYTFVASSLTKGEYNVAVTNEGGTVVSSSVTVYVNDDLRITADPQSTTVNPGADVVFSVTVEGPAPIMYQWKKDGAELTGAGASGTVAEVSGTANNGPHTLTYAIDGVSETDQGVYTLEMTNLAGTKTSKPATLSVNDPVSNVVASRTPSDTNAYSGDKITFTVTAAGTGPLSYRWYKDNQPLSTSASSNPNYVINSATLASGGTYRVDVTNAVNTVSSNDVDLAILDGKPNITLQPLAQTLLAGDELLLTTQATGKPVLKYQWKKNNANVVGAVSSTYRTTAATGKAGNGGVYTVEVSNSLSPKAVSSPVEIVVVGSAVTALPVKLGSNATLNADVSAGTKTVLAYKWFKDGVDMTTLPADPRITGITEKALKIAKTTLADSALYTCQIKAPGMSALIGSPVDLRVFDKKPELETFTLPDGIIGGTYMFQIPVNDSTDMAPVSYAATGLPPGLAIDKNTGMITGKPTATKNPYYSVKISAINSISKDETTKTLTVLTLPENIAGNYTGPVDRQPSLNGNLGGRIDLTVTTKATFSGKLFMGAASYSVSGALDIDVAGVVKPSATFSVKRTGTPLPAPLTVSFTLDPDTGLLSEGSITDGVDSTTFTGWRQIWDGKTVLASKYMGTYGFALDIPATSAGNDAIPQGNGYGAFTVAKDGKLSVAGMTADGDKITSATFVGPNGQVLMYSYVTASKASLAGHMLIDQGLDPDAAADNIVVAPPPIYSSGGDDGTGTDDGTGDDTGGGDEDPPPPPPPVLLPSYPITWMRPAATAATARVYKAGFGPIELTPAGGIYTPPTGTDVALNLHIGDSAQLVFAEGGIELSEDNPDITFTLDKGSKVVMPPKASNPCAVSLTLTTKTGAFKGSFTLEDPNPRTVAPTGPAKVKRTVSFLGQIIKDSDGVMRGYGYYLLPQLPGNGPPPTTATNSPQLSGQVLLQPVATP